MPENESHPYPAHEKLPNSEVEARIRLLTAEMGGRLVIPSFSAADRTQGDMIVSERRLFVTPNDHKYKKYVQVLAAAGMPHVKNDTEFGDQQVVVGEISRDARVLPLVIRSKPSTESGTTPRDVFRTLGARIGSLIVGQGIVPEYPRGSVLDRVLVLRREQEVMLLPGIQFIPVDDVNKDLVVTNVAQSLHRDYERFDTTPLIYAFKTGLEG